jgi:hypothetical protein
VLACVHVCLLVYAFSSCVFFLEISRRSHVDSRCDVFYCCYLETESSNIGQVLLKLESDKAGAGSDNAVYAGARTYLQEPGNQFDIRLIVAQV